MLLQSGCWREARGIIATTLAAQLTAEQGSKSCGDDKTSACRKTIHSDSSKEAPLIFQLQAGRRSTWLWGLEKKTKLLLCGDVIFSPFLSFNNETGFKNFLLSFKSSSV